MKDEICNLIESVHPDNLVEYLSHHLEWLIEKFGIAKKSRGGKHLTTDVVLLQIKISNII